MNKGTVFKNQEVIDYSFQGMGVIKIDNFTIFVPFVQKGQVIDVELTVIKKNYGFGKALNAKLKEVACPHYYECGSCNLMHLEYQDQIELKQNTLANLIRKNLVQTNLEPFQPTNNEFNYRNKIAMPVHFIDGSLKLGYYERNSHKLLPINNCLVADESLNAVISIIEKSLNLMHETAYNYKLVKGNVRHVVIRGNNDNVMVTIVTKSGKLRNQQLLVDMLTEASNVKSIVINTQKSKSRTILGKENKAIYGTDSIDLDMYGSKFKVKPNAFFQLNIDTTNMIYDYITSLTNFENKHLLDAFCGTGTIGLALADKAKSILGIEIDKEAVESAKVNKKQLGIENAKYICEDIEKAISKVNIDDLEIVIVDPPRSGLATNMKQALINMHIDELIYISCDPSTLIRDVSELITHYEVVSIKGFDMFPNTNHFETVAYLKKREV